MQALERHVFDVRNTGHVIVNSERVRTEILENFEFPAERIHLIRNGVETRQFETLDRREFRRRHGFSDEDFVISFVGSGWERKGLPFILNAMRLLPKTLNVCLLVAGKGGRPLWVPPRVTFAGPVRNVEEVYAASDLFITLPIYEPSANVVFEAMAAGLPVITSAYNGAAELLEEGITGSVIQNPADADAVAAQMLFWIQNGRRPSCPAPLRRFLDISRNVEETLALLESIVEQRRGAGTK
jgi:UDP-glucose:(heptosyl)LPS alpha-1,3-glucosyltransferase